MEKPEEDYPFSVSDVPSTSPVHMDERQSCDANHARYGSTNEVLSLSLIRMVSQTDLARVHLLMDRRCVLFRIHRSDGSSGGPLGSRYQRKKLNGPNND
ncbi:hypothetical protein CKAN_01500500 [Cinnamomum micranthum f. kanehirae]|uniref:Uncharacterized protein n=1 Tax=Cinnamomum micranthum f. kanehirae TaxID=337451 RepID=A0A3S3P9K8_9MAGN|nr:hypothetical protein CKAN_01500500 [Cinnamomum micranthum f. kanehirae]